MTLLAAGLLGGFGAGSGLDRGLFGSGDFWVVGFEIFFGFKQVWGLGFRFNYVVSS